MKNFMALPGGLAALSAWLRERSLIWLSSEGGGFAASAAIKCVYNVMGMGEEVGGILLRHTKQYHRSFLVLHNNLHILQC